MTKCLEGGSCTLHSLGFFHDDSGHNQPQEVVVCERCDLGFTLPELDNLASLYENRASREFVVDKQSWMRRLRTFFFKREALALLRQLPTLPANTLDFGCGEGRFTSVLSRIMAPEGKVTGADFDLTPPAMLEGTAYIPYPQLSGGYDLVIARHVLEHYNHPLEGLNAMKAQLAPGGLLFIEVPNRRSPWARLWDKYWDLWYTPFHRVHFSRASLCKSLELAGFEILVNGGTEMPSMGRSLRNLLGCRYNIALFGFAIATQPLQMLLARLYGEPACLQILARLKN